MYKLANALKDHNYSDKNAFFSSTLECIDDARRIAQRSVLIKSIHELFYQTQTFNDMLVKFKTLKLPINFKATDTFKVNVYAFNKTLSQQEKIEKIQKILQALELDDLKICLDDEKVTHSFYYYEEYKNDEKLDNRHKMLENCYFTRFIANGQSYHAKTHNLKERLFIGNTSMDPLLALIMSNMAHVRQNDFIYDPFVGTGSLLVSASHFGAYVCGADLDFNLMYARGLSSRMGQKFRKQEETIYNNLRQYGYQERYIDVITGDFSKEFLNDKAIFDAIITDPPYGIREKAKKIGKKSKKSKENSNEKNINSDEERVYRSGERIPQCKQYQLSEIYTDLLDFASRHLLANGRLVFWLPIFIENREASVQDLKKTLENFIPLHTHMSLLYFSEQRLSASSSRLLVTMKKQVDKQVLATNLENNSHLLLDNFRDKYFEIKN